MAVRDGLVKLPSIGAVHLPRDDAMRGRKTTGHEGVDYRLLTKVRWLCRFGIMTDEMAWWKRR
jgi:hypothetical protein